MAKNKEKLSFEERMGEKIMEEYEDKKAACTLLMRAIDKGENRHTLINFGAKRQDYKGKPYSFNMASILNITPDKKDETLYATVTEEEKYSSKIILGTLGYEYFGYMVIKREGEVFETIIEIRELILLTIGSEDDKNYIAQTSIGFGEGMVNIFNLFTLPLEK